MAATAAPAEAPNSPATLVATPEASATMTASNVEQSKGVSDDTVTPAAAPEPKPHSGPSLTAPSQAGLAIFSTDLGRRPKRDPPGPPYAPVIVVSDKVRGVVDFARSWQAKYPKQYLCFFPYCGHNIHDLWDNADIHLHSPGFLQEALKFITQDNVMCARNYAIQWSINNRERLHVVAEVEYHPAQPLAIVDDIFVNGETDEFPREFLWHVAHMMRYGMCEVAVKKKAVPSEAVAGTVAKVADSNASKLNLQTGPAAEHTSKAIPGNTRLPMAPNSGNVLQIDRQSHMMTQAPIPVHDTFTPQIPMQPHRHGYQPQVPMYPVTGPANARPMNVPPPRTGKTRNYRSSSYSQAPQQPGWLENMPMVHPGQQSRQTSGTMSSMTSPQVHHQIPVGPPMGGSGFHMGTMMSPPQVAAHMHPYQAPFQPGMQMGPRGAPMEFQQGYHGNHIGQRVVSIGDMTNSAPSFNTNLPHNDPNRPRHRRDSRTDRQPPRLYNPYKEKPEFANIPFQSRQRKGSRNGPSQISGDQPRGRRQSSSSGVPQYLGPGSFEPAMSSGEMFRSGWGQAPNAADVHHPDPLSVDLSDPLRGCGPDWIGPENTAVRELIVFEIPSTVKEEDLIAFFRQNAGVEVFSVRLKTDKNEKYLANVRFTCVADAIKALQLHRTAIIHGRNVAVRVPERLYAMWGPGHRSVLGMPPTASRTAYVQPPKPASARHAPRPTYSPQDARSDLTQGQALDKGMAMGSPEGRKGRKQNASPNKKGSPSPNKKQSATPTKKLSASSMKNEAAPQGKPLTASDKREQELPKKSADAVPGASSENKSTADAPNMPPAKSQGAAESKTPAEKPGRKDTEAVGKKQPEIPAGSKVEAGEPKPGEKVNTPGLAAQPSRQKNDANLKVPKPKDDAQLRASELRDSPKKADHKLRSDPKTKVPESKGDAKLEVTDLKQAEPKQKGAPKAKAADRLEDTKPKASRPIEDPKLKASGPKEGSKQADPKQKGDTKVKPSESKHDAKLKGTEPKDDAKLKATEPKDSAQSVVNQSSAHAKAKSVSRKNDTKAEDPKQKSGKKDVLPKGKPQSKAENEERLPADRSSGLDVKIPSGSAAAVKSKAQLEQSTVPDASTPVVDGGQSNITKDPKLAKDAPIETGTGARPTLVAEDTGSDEEQKNETSFHSAKEAQSDAGNDESAEMSDERAAAKAQPSIPMASGSQDDIPRPEKGKGRLDTTKSDTQSPNVPAKPSSPADKKPGAKQTEALFPYAKSKDQQRREKAQRKKEKKKAKTEKSAPATKASTSIKGQVTASTSQSPTQAKTDNRADASLPQEKNVRTQDGEVGHDGGKDIAPLEASVGEVHRHSPNGSPIEKSEQEAQHTQLQDRGVTSSEKEPIHPSQRAISPVEKEQFNETHVDTHAPVNTPAPDAELHSLNARLSDGDAISGSESSQPTIIINDEVAQPEGPESGPKDADAGSNTQAKANDKTDEARATELSLQAVIPLPSVPSPTAAEFHTALQTPTDAIIPNPEQPTATKKKSKKKKKKASGPTEVPAAEPSTPDSEPFSKQFRQIEMLREGVPSMSTDQGRQFAEETGSSVLPVPSQTQSIQELTDMQKTRSILSDVLGFMREKPRPYSTGPNRAIREWPGKNPPVELNHREVQNMMGVSANSEVPVAMDIDTGLGDADSGRTLV